MSNYVIWTFKSVPNACALTQKDGLNDIYKLYQGDGFETLEDDEYRFFMDPETPEEMLLTDNLLNRFGLAIISEKFKAFMNDLGLDYLTFAPAPVINHKQRETTENYFILHPMASIDCIDQKQSKIRFCPMVPEDIDRIKKLVLDESVIPKAKPIFRMAGFGNAIVVQRSIAEQIDQANFSGIGWTDIDKFKY